MARKKQGYNARLDESLGERNKGKKTQAKKNKGKIKTSCIFSPERRPGTREGYL